MLGIPVDYSSCMRTPLAPLSNRLRWKPASASSACDPTRAAKAGIAAASPASSLAKASLYCAGSRRRERLLLERLIGPQRLAPSAQDDVADRPALEIHRGLRDRLADADTRAEMLVGGFQPRRGVDGVAVGGVVEEVATAEIADQRRARHARRSG